MFYTVVFLTVVNVTEQRKNTRYVLNYQNNMAGFHSALIVRLNNARAGEYLHHLRVQKVQMNSILGLNVPTSIGVLTTQTALTIFFLR